MQFSFILLLEGGRQSCKPLSELSQDVRAVQTDSNTAQNGRTLIAFVTQGKSGGKEETGRGKAGG